MHREKSKSQKTGRSTPTRDAGVCVDDLPLVTPVYLTDSMSERSGQEARGGLPRLTTKSWSHFASLKQRKLRGCQESATTGLARSNQANPSS